MKERNRIVFLPTAEMLRCYSCAPYQDAVLAGYKGPGWYFEDEAYQVNGPFQNEYEASNELEKYARYLNQTVRCPHRMASGNVCWGCAAVVPRLSDPLTLSESVIQRLLSPLRFLKKAMKGIST